MRDIKGYEGLYAVTSCGKVWSYKSNKFLSAANNGQGYYQVILSKDNVRKHYRVHRLVAEAYIDNPHNLPLVNHKDEDKSNNCINNLEWVSAKDNVNYGTAKERSKQNRQYSLIMCVETGDIYKNQKKAAEAIGTTAVNISNCLRGLQKTAGGYHWKRVNKGGKE